MVPNNSAGARVSPSIKKHIVETRTVMLLFRVFQVFGALGAFITMVLLTKVSPDMGWIMRILVRYACCSALIATNML